jgi:hypothetical protein
MTKVISADMDRTGVPSLANDRCWKHSAAVYRDATI